MKLSVILCSFLVLAAAASAEVVDSVVRVISVRGQVTDGNGAALKEGSLLHTADSIKTGANSIADITIIGKGLPNSVLRVNADSELSFAKLTEYHFDAGPERDNPYLNIQLDVKGGSVLANVKKPVTGKYELKTASGVAGIRGTAFKLSSDGTLSVLEGSVDSSVQLPNGQVIHFPVAQGQHLTMNPKIAALLANGGVSVNDLYLYSPAELGEVWSALNALQQASRAGYALNGATPMLDVGSNYNAIIMMNADPQTRQKIKKQGRVPARAPNTPAPNVPAFAGTPAPAAPNSPAFSSQPAAPGPAAPLFAAAAPAPSPAPAPPPLPPLPGRPPPPAPPASSSSHASPAAAAPSPAAAAPAAASPSRASSAAAPSAPAPAAPPPPAPAPSAPAPPSP